MSESIESEEQPSIITAFIKHPDPVESHEEVPGVEPNPVRVLGIDSQGARLAEDLPGQAVIYDLVTYKTEVRTRNTITGYEDIEVPIENPEEGGPETQILSFPVTVEEEYKVQVPKITTYAATASES